MKKLFFLNLLFLLNINSYDITKLSEDLTPENTVFVFDFHGVILKKSGDSVKNFMQHPYRFKFLNRLRKGGIRIGGNNDNICVESKFIDSSDDSDYVDETLKLINPHIPDFAAIGLIKTLHEKGFKIFGCSNIGERSLEYMQNKFSNFGNLIKNCFSGLQIPTKENNFATKDKTKTFIDCKNLIIQEFGKCPKFIILVDDSITKINVAEKAAPEFKGYHFFTVKKFEEVLKVKKAI